MVRAWNGYLKTCKCKKPDHCPVDDVKVIDTGNGFRWVRKMKVARKQAVRKPD